MDRTPKPGEFYRHFKGRLYQVTAIAVHSETKEKMVVYQALYGTFGVYVRPLSMFVSEVDHEKYPQAEQKYRFEKMDMTEENQDAESQDPVSGTFQEAEDQAEDSPNKNLLAFLDAETYHEKLEILLERKDNFSEEELSAICEIMEIGRADSEPEEKYYAIKRYLELQDKFDGARLR